MLITGGNGGIGLGIGRACAKAGADIIVWGRSAEKNEQAEADLRALGVAAHALVVDASDEAAVETGFAASVELAGGRIDSVFANAGVGGSGGGGSKVGGGCGGASSGAAPVLSRHAGARGA